MIPAGIDTRELHDTTYRCLDDCGFCCTFTAEVNATELTPLRTQFPTLPITRNGEMTLLGLQGGCGACTLLKNRKCTAYDLRPAHCRYFPFHLYFGRTTQAYVNKTCRGVEPAPGRHLQAEFHQQLSSSLNPYRLRKLTEKSQTVHSQFERNARRTGTWADLDQTIHDRLQMGPNWFQPDLWPPTPTGQDDEAGSPTEAWQVTLQSFQATDPVARPYHLTAQLQWLGFQANDTTLHSQTLTEDGRLQPHQDLGAFDDWPTLPPRVRDGLATTMQRLAQRDLLAGTIMHLVDDTDYTLTIPDATDIRLADIAAGLAIRADILHRLGIPWDLVPAETERFYDSAFLDHPTIGGWL